MATNSFQNKKQTLNDEISNAQSFEDLIPMFKSLELNEMKAMLSDYVSAETTPNHKIAKLYHEAVALTTIMPDAITQSVMAFLSQPELPGICRVNKIFNAISKKLQNSSSYWNDRLLAHPVFKKMFTSASMKKDKEHEDRRKELNEERLKYGGGFYYNQHKKIGFFLENKYTNEQLNNFNKDGKFLIGSDKIIVKLCRKHKISFKLDGYVVRFNGQELLMAGHFGNEQTDRYWEDYVNAEIEEKFGARPGKFVNGYVTESHKYGGSSDWSKSPVFIIELPLVQWRKSFLEERIKK